MIPKVIHCVWIGGVKTGLVRPCRASWECFAPEFAIREWGLVRAVDGWRLTVDGDDAGPVRLPDYVGASLAAKKWAFASDWLRFYVLEREGGVYFDYDLELVRALDDLPDGEWCAGEWVEKGARVQFSAAALALERGSITARRMLTAYETLAYGDGRTVGDIMNALGLDVKLLPPAVFCPSDWQGRVTVTAETWGIHHYALSWISPRRRVARWLNWHGLGWLTDVLLKVRRTLSCAS